MQCRIAVTLQCNRDCWYCCMKQEHIITSFDKRSLEKILKKKYETFIITGGEPTTNIKTLIKTVSKIKEVQPKSKTYLYTNGYGLNTQMVRNLISFVDGINYSIHEEMAYVHLAIYNEIIPIRIHIWETLLTDKLREFCLNYNIPLNAWKMNDCETVNEDRFIMEEELK